MIARHLLGNAYPIKKLESVVDFLDHKRRPITESDRKPGPYPYYGANGPQGWIDDYIFDEPLILLAEDGGHFDSPDRGVAYRVSGKTWVNNHAHVLRPTEEVDIGFLCRVLENYDLTPFITGTTRGKLTKAGASEIPVIVPPLEEQHRIAAILDQAETLRTQRRAALALLDSLTQSLFLDMFGDPVANPKGWSMSTIGDLAEVQGGLQVTSARKNLPVEVPYLRVANVYRGVLDLSEIKTIRATPAEIQRTTLVKDDLLVVEGHGNPNEIGRAALWNGEIEQCVHQNHLIRARFDCTKVEPVFASEYVNSPGGRQHLLRAGKSTSGLNTISVSNVRETPIALPPLRLQQTFATRIASIEALKATHHRALAALDTLFASLQQRAFAGQL